MRAAVFLDRDDTLVHNRDLPVQAGVRAGDLIDPEMLRLLPGALEACRELKAAGFVLVVITNQGVIARGGSLDDLADCHERLGELLSDESGEGLLDGLYSCPFHPEGSVAEFAIEHEWRKPRPGMILAAIEDLGIDIDKSWMVGDAQRDMDAGLAAGIDGSRCLLLEPVGEIAGMGEAAGIILGATR